MSVTLEEQIKCVAREIAMRRNVYRRRVSQDVMSQAEADREIETMEAVQASLRLMQAPVPELRGTLPLILYFPSDDARDCFIALMKEAKPNLVSKKI